MKTYKQLMEEFKQTRTMFGPITLDKDIFHQHSQQYDSTGKPGLGHEVHYTHDGKRVNAITHREADGKLTGILNHYPQDIPEKFEKAGRVVVMVHPDHQKKGIGSTLLKAAIKKWGVDLNKQKYTADGARLANSVSRGNLSEMAQDPHKAGYQFHVISDDSDCGVHTIVATHPSAHQSFAWRCLGSRLRDKLPESVRDQIVGHTQIQHDARPILGQQSGFMDKPHDLYVDDDHRRKGVASGMYDAYQKHTGRPVKPSPFQTKDAEALWKDRRKKR